MAREDKTIVFDPAGDIGDVAEQARADLDILEALVQSLSGSERRVRQFSAAALNKLSENDAELLVSYTGGLVEALSQPEAQTRWQILEVLARTLPFKNDGMEEAVAEAENCLFDETFDIVRLHAFSFMTAYAATSDEHGKDVWPLIDEAIQCYHGDPEFNGMLTSLMELAGSSASREVKDAIVARMSFDAEFGRGTIKRRAGQIVEAAKK